MRGVRISAAFIGLVLSAAPEGRAVAQQAPVPGNNPLFEASTLPHGAPRFDRITSADFREALDRGMREERADIDRITAVSAEATFANTIEALERSGALLRQVSRTFNVLLQAHSDATLQDIDVEYAPILAAHRDAISLDPALFARVKTMYDRREGLRLEADQLRLVDRLYRGFVRAGAALSEDGKTRMRAVNAEMAALVSALRRDMLAEMNAAALVVDDKALLDGLPEPDIAAAAAAAASRGLEGRWVLPLQNTTHQPALAHLRNRAMRERLFKASAARNAGAANNTSLAVIRLAQLRAERAALLGFPTHAAFSLDDQMAKNPERAMALLAGMVPAVTARTRDEAGRLEARMRLDGVNGALEPWDWQFYAEEVRKADYALDDEEVRQYFEFDRVLRDGVFHAATRLYGITFEERPDIPVYHPDVRVFEVIDKDGATPVGLVYLDYFARPTKRGGAWMNSLSVQSTLLGTTPAVTNVGNFVKPSPGNAALLSAAEVVTMFHEFGHALHALFSNVRYPTLSATAVPRDFVEVPSQFNEHWALEPSVFERYARHYQTGEPMPASLRAKMDRARLFNEGYARTELLAAAFVDFEWHLLRAGEPMPDDVDAFEAAALRRHRLAVREVPPRYGTRYFSHIWTLGYAAGYYAYTWSAVLEIDAYYWFKERGGMTAENGQRFRDMVLSRGGTQDAEVLYREFRGRDASIEPLLIERGLK